jgi:hypothetical protein
MKLRPKRWGHALAPSLHLKDEPLRQAQKMEAICRLADGAAADFKKIFSTIIVSSSFVGANLPKKGEARNDLNDILKAAYRAARFTRLLLAFSRRRPIIPPGRERARRVA